MGSSSTHEFSFGAQDGISLSGYNLFKNASSLYAIIILLDNTGVVVNTNKVLVTGHNSGIEFVSPDAVSVKTEYYDINGRSVKDPSKGIFIKVETREDGKRKVTKMVK